MFIQIKKEGHARGLISEYKYQLLVLGLIITVPIGSCLMTGQPGPVRAEAASKAVRTISPNQNMAQVTIERSLSVPK